MYISLIYIQIAELKSHKRAIAQKSDSSLLDFKNLIIYVSHTCKINLIYKVYNNLVVSNNLHNEENKKIR